MYLAGVSVRRVEDIAEALWGTRVSPGTVSNLNKKIYGQIEAWRKQPIGGVQPYLYQSSERISLLAGAEEGTGDRNDARQPRVVLGLIRDLRQKLGQEGGEQ